MPSSDIDSDHRPDWMQKMFELGADAPVSLQRHVTDALFCWPADTMKLLDGQLENPRVEARRYAVESLLLSSLTR